MTTIATHANEGASYVLTVAFTDDTGAAVTPASASWSLYDEAEAIVNSRSAVAISPLSPSVTVVLAPGDTALTGYQGVTRTFAVVFTYTSSLGTLTGRAQAQFTIDSVVGVG